MKKTALITFILSILFSIGLYPSEGNAQDNNTNNTSDIPESYVKLYEDLELNGKIDFYYKFGINLAKYEELKSIGLDFKQMDRTFGKLNFKYATLVSHSVVVGKIVKRTYDSDPDAFYHTTFEIEVTETVKGENIPSTIYVHTESGMSGDSYLRHNHEPQLFLGEEVLLFLYEVPFDELKEAQEKGFLRYEINVSEETTTYLIREKFSIKANYLFDSDNEKTEEKFEEVKSKVQEIVEINKP